LSIPVRSPRGTLIGVDFRTWGEEKKTVREFRLPEAAWNPTFTGVWPESLARIWAGGDVWIVEGLFDLALARVIPAKDVALATVRVTPCPSPPLLRHRRGWGEAENRLDRSQDRQAVCGGSRPADAGRCTVSGRSLRRRQGSRRDLGTWRNGRTSADLPTLGGLRWLPIFGWRRKKCTTPCVC
jgi:hypothetical protein